MSLDLTFRPVKAEDKSRILDFTRFDPQTGAREPITSDEWREKAVWEMAGDHGRDVAVAIT